LDTDELKRWADAVILQAKLHYFPNSFHESVEVLSLSMTAPQRRNSGDIIAIFVSFDDNRELSLRFHLAILPRGKQGPVEVAPTALNLGATS
jgi:hypothetical protein